MRRRPVQVTTAKAGQCVTRPEVFHVSAVCDKDEGHWYCDTHQKGFVNNIQKDTHISRGRHRMVWWCHLHGPEQATAE